MKTIKKIALVIIFIFLLMIWSGIVRNVSLGERSFGVLSGPIKGFSEVVSNMKKTYTYIFKAPDYYLKTNDKDSLIINKLSYNLYGLYSYRHGDEFKIELKNFKDNTLKHEWNVPVSSLAKRYKVDGNDRLYPATLMPNFDIIVSCNERPGLLRMDANSNEKWFNNDFIFHHAMNKDSLGNIWIPAVKHEQGVIVPMKVEVEGHTTNYRDDLIVKFDPNTGKTMYSKSLTDMFLENNLDYLINKSPYVNDPFHLNDIQPVLVSSDYFLEGDLFLSFRSPSLVVQFRPSTNKIVKVLEGPFTFQHDVDIISPNSIAILNNSNIVTQVIYNDIEFKPTNLAVNRKINHSNVLIYNFEEDSYRAVYEDVFKEHQIHTGAEGLYRMLPNGDMFFEEQGAGILWIINQYGVVLKTILKSDKEGYHYLPNWTTTYLDDELESLN